MWHAWVQSKRKAAFFWINAMAPLTSVILGSVLVYFTKAEKHGVEVVNIHYSLIDLYIMKVIFIY